MFTKPAHGCCKDDMGMLPIPIMHKAHPMSMIMLTPNLNSQAEICNLRALVQGGGSIRTPNPNPSTPDSERILVTITPE